MAKYNGIYLVTPEPIKNMGNLRNYFIENTQHFTTFHFPNGYANVPSRLEQYDNGKKIIEKSLPKVPINNKLIKLISHYIYFVTILLFHVKKGSIVIVENPIFCIFYSVFSYIKNLRFVLIIGDYHIEKTGFMKIYHMLLDFYNRHIPYIIYLSPPIQEIYSPLRAGNLHRSQLSLGIADLRIANRQDALESKLHIGFMGSIRHGQGLQTLIEYVHQTTTPLHLDIIGDGYELNFYKNLVRDLTIEDKVTFHGFAPNREEIASKWHIAFALYDYHPSNLSLYCEPTKIKDYLSYGLPVITTKTTYFHKAIASFGAGEIVEENSQDIDRAVHSIISAYSSYKQGVQNIIKAYAYRSHYDKQLEFLQTYEHTT